MRRVRRPPRGDWGGQRRRVSDGVGASSARRAPTGLRAIDGESGCVGDGACAHTDALGGGDDRATSLKVPAVRSGPEALQGGISHCCEESRMMVSEDDV